MTALERVCGVLDAHRLSHALIGAAALAARGIARSTYDIDILTVDPRALDPSLWTTFPESVVDIRRGDLDDPLAGVTRIALEADRPIDIVVGKHGWQARALERAEPVAGGPPIVLARDLVLLKLYAGGSQDLWDIRELLQLHGPPLDAEVAADVSMLPAESQRRWESVRTA